MKAKELLSMNGMEAPALMTIRNALESLVKYLCRICSIEYDTRETDLSVMIDAVYNSGLIADSTRSLMHKTRQLCNKGAHVDENVSASDAVDAYNYMGEIFKAVSSGLSEESVSAASAANNVPMEYPDYYSPNRRYYGKWAHCYTRQSLLMIPEYVQLERKANEGDVAACLDIASGFLPRNLESLWNESQLINMPDYVHRGRAYNQAEAYDMRYYYWIMNAVMEAGLRLDKKDFPMKYIATAVWEADLLWFNYYTKSSHNLFISGVREYYDRPSGQYQYIPEYSDQYVMAANMFGSDPDELNDIINLYGFYKNVRRIRREMFKGPAECRIVAPIFEEATMNPQVKLRFIEYCCKAFTNQVLWDEPKEHQFLTEADAAAINGDIMLLGYYTQGSIPGSGYVKEGDLITWDMLKPYTAGSFCSKYYYEAINNANACVRRERKEKAGSRGLLGGVKKLFAIG